MNRLERILWSDVHALIAGRMSSGVWRALAYRDPNRALSRGRSQNHYRLALLCRTIVDCRRGRPWAVAHVWREVVSRDGRTGLHGGEAFGQYWRWNLGAEVLAWSFLLHHAPNAATDSHLREQIRRSVAAWAATSAVGRRYRAQRREPFARHWSDRDSGARVLYEGPGGVRRGERQLPWSWAFTEADWLCAHVCGFHTRTSGSLSRSDVVRAVSDAAHNLRGGGRLLRNDERQMLREVLNSSLDDAVWEAWQHFATGLRVRYTYEILRSSDRISTFPQRFSNDGSTAAPDLFVWNPNEQEGRVVWRYGDEDRVRGREVRPAQVLGFPGRPGEWNVARRNGFIRLLVRDSEGEYEAGVPFVGRVRRVTLFPSQPPHVSIVNN